ncbi:MAG: beta-ketoacyl synthase N-terminal-like domain-containing protein, partial [Pseudanabaena sp.]
MKFWDRAPDSTTVVVTGIGMITAITHNRESTWQQILQGKSGIKFDVELKLPIARIENLDNSSQVSSPQSRAEYLLHTTVLEAIADAHLEFPLTNCGVVIGSSR